MTPTWVYMWDLVLKTASTIIVVIAAIAGAIKYFKERKQDREVRMEELSWRKTKFIFELAENFDKDQRFQRALKMIELGNEVPEGSTLAKILGPDIKTLNKEEVEARFAVDRYLDFFDRLYHFTFVTKSLNARDLECFLWYLRRIAETEEIRGYAKLEGYEDVLFLYEELKKCLCNSTR